MIGLLTIGVAVGLWVLVCLIVVGACAPRSSQIAMRMATANRGR